MAQQPEAKIAHRIADYISALPNGYARKTHGSPYSVAWPDIIGSINGRMIAIEVKTPTGSATPRQLRELARWQRAGAVTMIARRVEDVERALSDESLICEQSFEIAPVARVAGCTDGCNPPIATCTCWH